MVDNYYNKYRIENIKRINSRYYLVEIHGRSYIWDFFDLGDYRNYYPFYLYYPRRNSWRIYDVTGKEHEYKSREQINRHVPKPLTIQLEPLFLLAWLIALTSVYVFILIYIAMNLFRIWYIKRVNRIEVKSGPRYELQVANVKRKEDWAGKFNKWSDKAEKILSAVLLSALIIASILAAIGGEGIEGFLLIFSFFGAVLFFWLGTVGNSIHVPDINIKYQIIEKKEK